MIRKDWSFHDQNSEAALYIKNCFSYKKLFWKYATNLQENTHAEL